MQPKNLDGDMNTIIDLIGNISNKTYTDNNGTQFNTSLVPLESTTNVIDRGYLYFFEGSITPETARVIEIIDSTHVIVQTLTGAFTRAAKVIPLAADNTAAGIPEVVPNASQVKIFPSWCRAKDANVDRADIKTLKTDAEKVANGFKNFSKNVILRKDGTDIVIEGSSTQPIKLCTDGITFYDDTDITLDLTTAVEDPELSGAYLGDQFFDIYIEEDTTRDPIAPNTQRIKLTAQASGTAAYSTTAGASQYNIGSAYLKDGAVIGVHSLYIPVNDCHGQLTNASYTTTIDSVTAYQYGSDFYYPVFEPCTAKFNFMIGMSINTTATEVTAETQSDFNCAVTINDVILEDVRIKKKCLVKQEGRIQLIIECENDFATSQLLEISVGACLNESNDVSVINTTPNRIDTVDLITRVYFNKGIMGPGTTSIAPNPILEQTEIALYGSDLDHHGVWIPPRFFDITRYKDKVYISSADFDSGLNYSYTFGKIHVVDPDTAAFDHFVYSGGLSSGAYKGNRYKFFEFNNELYCGFIGASSSGVITHAFNGTTWRQALPIFGSSNGDFIAIGSLDNTLYAMHQPHMVGAATGEPPLTGTPTLLKSTTAQPGDWTVHWEGTFDKTHKAALYSGPYDLVAIAGGLNWLTYDAFEDRDSAFVYRITGNKDVEQLTYIGRPIIQFNYKNYVVAITTINTKISYSGTEYISVAHPPMEIINDAHVVNNEFVLVSGGHIVNPSDRSKDIPALYCTTDFKSWNRIDISAITEGDYYYGTDPSDPLLNQCKGSAGAIYYDNETGLLWITNKDRYGFRAGSPTTRRYKQILYTGRFY